MDINTIYAAAVGDEQQDMADQASNKVFGEVLQSAVGHSDRAIWEKVIVVYEDEYMENTQGNNPNAKFKDGRWKYRTYLPQKYNSSKSLVGCAIDEGIQFGGSESKKDIEELRKAKKAEETPQKTNLQKAEQAWNTFKILYDKLDYEQQSSMNDTVNKQLFGSL